MRSRKPSREWTPAKTFRLAVSGDVELSDLEVRICDTPAFQRLRKLKQLGLSYLVYPSAQHTRFEHALGSLQKARHMVEAIKSNPQSEAAAKTVPTDDYVLVRLAALLHDVGNLPFGHTLEDEGCVVVENQEDKTRLERFIGRGTEIGNILSDEIGKDGQQTLLAILTTKHNAAKRLGERAYIADIVKNTVCADLLDYLERDSYHCNLNISIGDRFMRYLFLTPVNGAKRLAIRLWKEKDQRPRPDLLSELTFLLEARYHIAERVYFHHARTAISAMISRAVWSALQGSGRKKLTVEQLYEMGDQDLLNRLIDSDVPQAKQLGTMLRDRRLYKRVDQVDRDIVQADKTHDRLTEMDITFHRNAGTRVQIEDQVADLCGLDSGDVLINCPDPHMNLKAAEMLVTWRNDIMPLKEIDDPLIDNRTKGILKSHENLWQCKVFIHPEKREDEEVLRLVKDVAGCHLRGDGQYGRETIQRVIEELAEREQIPLFASQTRTVADNVLAPAREGAALTRSLLRSELRKLAQEQRKTRSRRSKS